MEFEKFKSNITILNKSQGKELRSKYIETFIDTKCEIYKKYIAKKELFSDGYCYTSYLWDCLIKEKVIKEKYIEMVSNGMENVFVLWDIHSCDRIYIEDYWRFDKDAVLSMKFSLLMEGLEYLPEDIYIFDETYRWTLVYTHEDIDGERYCLKSGEIQLLMSN